jgi:hypothetical protein
MKKRIHILTADEHRKLMGGPEPPFPVGTFYAVETADQRWEIRQIRTQQARRAIITASHRDETRWREQQVSTHDSREEVKCALVRLIIRSSRKASSAKKPKVVDTKHYWLKPPELWAQIKAEFGPDIFDPCPYPRPPGFNGLYVEWGDVNWVNPLFRKTDGEGITHWVKKMIEQQKKGRTSMLPYPTYTWFHLLLNACVEMRSLGQVHWLAIEDGTPQKSSLPIVLFILRGKKKTKKKK